MGYDVAVLTAMPNYPKGEVFEGYRGKLRYVETIRGVRVVRTWIFSHRGASILGRSTNYFSFCITSLLLGACGLGNVDVLFTESPPLFLGITGWLLSKWKGALFIFNVSDLWPESVVKLGVVSNPRIIRLATCLEEFLYRKADMVTGQTEGIVEDISGRLTGRRAKLLTNGVDLQAFSSEFRDHSLRYAWGGDDRFVVGYAGNIGIAQGLEIIVKAASLLRDRENIRVVIVGDGADRPRLEAFCDSLDLRNVIMMPLQPRERMPAILASFDAAVVPLKRLDLFRGALPSKLFEAMASCVPILLCVEGEAARLVRAAGAGWCLPPEDEKALAAGILRLLSDQGSAKRMGEAGREYVRKYYDREQIAKQFTAYVADLVASRGPVA